MDKQNRNKLIDTEDILMVCFNGKGVEGMCEKEGIRSANWLLQNSHGV